MNKYQGMKLKSIFLGITLIILSCNNTIVAEEINDLEISKKITLTSFPKNNQLYPRNSNNKAIITIAGIIKSPIDSLYLKVYRQNNKVTKHLLTTQNSFSIQIEITAALHNYSIELYGKNKKGITTLIKKATNVTAGDVYVVHGQSNAWAIDYDNKYNNQDLPNNALWVRTVGAMHVYNSEAILPEAKNTDWFLASGKAPDIRNGGPKIGLGMVGVLGMRLGINLVESEKIPIAIINGAGGGGSISYYQKSGNQNLDKPYERLQNRLEASGVKDNIKAFIWNQGENNASDAINKYKNALTYFYNSLKGDFTFEKFYLIQTPPGCRASNGHQNVREAQRQFSIENKNVRILTRHGFPSNPDQSDGNYFLSDGCHYHAYGYEILANWIAKLAKFDFYGDPTSYEAPQLLQIELEASNVLTLTFDKKINIQTKKTINGKQYSVKEHLFAINNKSTSISSIEIITGNSKKIRVTFSNQTLTKKDTLTYILGDNYPNTSTPFQGPWIVDLKTGVGAVGFTKKIE